MGDDTRKPDYPRAPVRPARVRRVGEPLPEPPGPDLVPELTGPTVKLNAKIDAATVDLINEHAERLYRLCPDFPTTASDAIRSLLHRGAREFRADDRTQPDDE